MQNNSQCTPEDEESMRLLCKALDGCTEEQARARLWLVAPSLHMDPAELLGFDVD